MKRTIDILRVNISLLMNENGLTYPQVDRMKIRDECEVTGRFLRQIVVGEREPGLKKLDAIADLFGVQASALLTAPREINDAIEMDDGLKNLIKKYSGTTDEGREAIENIANFVPKAAGNRNNGGKNL